MDVYLQFQEFKSFADLRRRLEPPLMVIVAYGKVNGLLTKEDLKCAAEHVRFFYQVWCAYLCDFARANLN
jgi:hypothetical protein